MADLGFETLFNVGALFDELDDAIPKLRDGVRDFAADVSDEVNSRTSKDDSLFGLFSGFVDDLSDITFPTFGFTNLSFNRSDRLSDRFNSVADSVLQSIEDVADYSTALVNQTTEFVGDIEAINLPFLDALASDETDDIFRSFTDFASDVAQGFGEGVNIDTEELLELSIGDRVIDVVEDVSDVVDGILTTNLFDDIKDAADVLPSLTLTVSASSEPANGTGERQELIGTATVTPREIGADGRSILETTVSFVL